MKKLILMIVLLVMTGEVKAQVDPPIGYTTNYKFRMWDDGDNPSADSLNQNWKDIDAKLYLRQQGIDSLRTAILNKHEISGSFRNPLVFSPSTPAPTVFEIANGYPLHIKVGGKVTTIFDEDGDLTIGSLDTGGAGNLYAFDIFAHDISAESMVLTDGLNMSASDIVGTGDVSVSNGNFTGTVILYEGDAQLNLQVDESDNAAYIFSPTGVASLKFKSPAGAYWTIDAGTYKTSGTTGYLSSAYGTKTASGLFVASSSGGPVTTELNYANVTINGVTYKILIADP